MKHIPDTSRSVYKGRQPWSGEADQNEQPPWELEVNCPSSWSKLNKLERVQIYRCIPPTNSAQLITDWHVPKRMPLMQNDERDPIVSLYCLQLGPRWWETMREAFVIMSLPNSRWETELHYAQWSLIDDKTQKSAVHPQEVFKYKWLGKKCPQENCGGF